MRTHSIQVHFKVANYKLVRDKRNHFRDGAAQVGHLELSRPYPRISSQKIEIQLQHAV